MPRKGLFPAGVAGSAGATEDAEDIPEMFTGFVEHARKPDRSSVVGVVRPLGSTSSGGEGNSGLTIDESDWFCRSRSNSI